MKPGRGHREQGQQPRPQRTPERLDLALLEATEKRPNRVVARETLDAEDGVQGTIPASPIDRGKTTRPGNHGEEKSREGMGQRNGIGGSWRGKRNRLGDACAKADLLEKGDETGEAAPRRY